MEVNIRIAGAAGQGTQTSAELLGKALTRAGLFAHCHTDAESRIRGGLNFSHLRVSDRRLAGVRSHVDVLVAQSEDAVHVLGELPEGSLLLAQKKTDHPRALPLELAQIAREAGAEKAAGTVALGAIGALLSLESEFLRDVLREHFAKKPEVLAFNLRAAELGAAALETLGFHGRFALPAASPSGRLWLSGGEAVALGAVGGGVSFFAGYPMSPATSIMAALAGFAPRAGLHVEQAEDEIAAINMVAAASFAGARSMTATSGGGFCLMTEGVSLLGMTEIPAVVCLAQRPGPATGLPTRVAQGDLNLVRHAGHGYFPRIILAPRDIPDCFSLTAAAFDLAERFQSPVFVLTDQLINDSRMTCDRPNLSALSPRRHFLPPEELERLEGYSRYAWADDGLSPMAMPGKSRHLVFADSDEHDEEGHITESGIVADRMARKRLAKGESMRRAAWPCETEGDPAASTLVVSWGSTYETVREALETLAREGKPARHLQLRWLWPPPEGLAELLRGARRLVAVEASVSGGIAELLREVGLRTPDALIGRKDGRPFRVDELQAELQREVRA
jgi:2-oxoglutarate/2-oxoacid ferredoxin oxidoreductase subunit alpha